MNRPFNFLSTFIAASVATLVANPPILAETFQVPAGTERLGATVSDGDELKLTFQLGRSYCCEGLAQNNPFGFSGVVDNAGQTLPSAVARGVASPILGNGLEASRAFNRFCFNGELVAGSSVLQVARCVVNIGSPRTNVILRSYETTLIGGFNTSVTDFNFLEITNTLVANAFDNGVVTGRVIARNAINDTVVLDTTFEVNPGDRIDINLHEPAGSGVFGPIQVSHNAPLGALQATVSQYRIVSTSPFDFEPAAQSVLRPAGAQ